MFQVVIYPGSVTLSEHGRLTEANAAARAASADASVTSVTIYRRRLNSTQPATVHSKWRDGKKIASA